MVFEEFWTWHAVTSAMYVPFIMRVDRTRAVCTPIVVEF